MSKKNRHRADSGNPGGKREQKRQQFQTPPSSRPSRAAWLIVASICVVAGALIALSLMGGGAATSAGGGRAGATRVATSAEGQVRLALADLAGGQAQFFEYPAADGRNIRFFALKGQDGIYRAALDACEVCYYAKKGYYQSGDEMVCRQCGNSYAPVLIDESPGGCHPMALPRRVDGDQLVVLASDIERVDAQMASQPQPDRPMQRGSGRGW